MMSFTEMDPMVPLKDQMEEAGGGPVVLVNKFTVPAGEVDGFMRAWTEDAAVMKRQPGFIRAQLHRGTAGSGVFLNYAVWESATLFKAAFNNPEFRAKLGAYPSGADASPHLFRKVAVPGICVA